MAFLLSHCIEILERTPDTLNHMLTGLSQEWTHQNEGENTWNVFEVIGHLIHGEHTDWIARATLILSDAQDKTFAPFDRFAQLHLHQGKTLEMLLQEFREARMENLQTLKGWNLSESDLVKTGTHPVLGIVTLQQLIATWVVHDLNHLWQISRIMSKQYEQEVGPFHAFLGIYR